jgi:hypothetical protein
VLQPQQIQEDVSKGEGLGLPPPPIEVTSVEQIETPTLVSEPTASPTVPSCDSATRIGDKCDLFADPFEWGGFGEDFDCVPEPSDQDFLGVDCTGPY